MKSEENNPFNIIQRIKSPTHPHTQGNISNNRQTITQKTGTNIGLITRGRQEYTIKVMNLYLDNELMRTGTEPNMGKQEGNTGR